MSRSATVAAYWASPAAAHRRNIVTRTCEECFELYSGHPRRIGRQFCSCKCRAANTKKTVTKSCAQCETEFSGPPSQMRLRRHCSKDCQRRSYPFVCEGCGNEGRSRYLGRRFCSDPCRLAWFSTHFRGELSPQWRGGAVSYYGPSWRAARVAARFRDGFRCRDCGAREGDLPERLSVAHVVPFRLFGLERHEEANALDNLRSLCRPCHIAFDHANGTRSPLADLLDLEFRQVRLEGFPA